MYSYTADEPAVARDNVVRYAGRVQGGDFRWGFDNSKDDAAYAVNQALKDALVAYKGYTGSVYQGGAEPQSSSSSAVTSSSSSAKSSSSTPTDNPSSSSVESSNSVESSSSMTDEPESSSSEDKQALVSVAPDAPALRYIAADRRLEIGVAGAFRVSVVRMDGQKVLSSTARVVDLSGLPAGVYLVRLVNKYGMIIQRINKQ